MDLKKILEIKKEDRVDREEVIKAKNRMINLKDKGDRGKNKEGVNNNKDLLFINY